MIKTIIIRHKSWIHHLCDDYTMFPMLPTSNIGTLDASCSPGLFSIGNTFGILKQSLWHNMTEKKPRSVCISIPMLRNCESCSCLLRINICFRGTGVRNGCGINQRYHPYKRSYYVSRDEKSRFYFRRTVSNKEYS